VRLLLGAFFIVLSITRSFPEQSERYQLIMWIVNIALRRPHTFLVAALLILLTMPFVLSKMATDIFPAIEIPVIAELW